jgi:hypothetical protein
VRTGACDHLIEELKFFLCRDIGLTKVRELVTICDSEKEMDVNYEHLRTRGNSLYDDLIL